MTKKQHYRNLKSAPRTVLGLTTEYPKNERDYAMGQSCPDTVSEEVNEMLDLADERACQSCRDWEEYAREMPAIEAAEKDFHRAVEESGREDLARERAEKDEKDPEYQAKVQTATKLEIQGGDHQVLIKGFDVSRINNEDTAKVQALFPAIVSQTAKEMEFTGKLPPLEMDERGRIWATPEDWHQKEGRATGEFHKYTAEMKFGKSEDELTPKQKDALTQQQMDTQLHWNFHTVHEILFTDDDRLEVERICIEHSHTHPGWEKKVSEYAGKRAKEGRIDEVFCEFGRRFMTNIRTSPDKPTKLEGLNPELYSFIKDRLERLSRLSETLGLKIGAEK